MMNVSKIYYFLTFLAMPCKTAYMPNANAVTKAIALHEVAKNDWV